MYDLHVFMPVSASLCQSLSMVLISCYQNMLLERRDTCSRNSIDHEIHLRAKASRFKMKSVYCFKLLSVKVFT